MQSPGQPSPRALLAGPDAESARWTQALAARLGLDAIIARKTRHADRAVSLVFPPDPPVAGRKVILVDDVISSGGTILAAAEALRAAGAASLEAVCVHALYDAQAEAAFRAAGIALPVRNGPRAA